MISFILLFLIFELSFGHGRIRQPVTVLWSFVGGDHYSADNGGGSRGVKGVYSSETWPSERENHVMLTFSRKGENQTNVLMVY